MNKDTSDVGTDVSRPLGLTIADKGVIMLLNNWYGYAVGTTFTASAGNSLPIPRSIRGKGDISRNELRRGRDTSGPYRYPICSTT